MGGYLRKLSTKKQLKKGDFSLIPEAYEDQRHAPDYNLCLKSDTKNTTFYYLLRN